MGRRRWRTPGVRGLYVFSWKTPPLRVEVGELLVDAAEAVDVETVNDGRPAVAWAEEAVAYDLALGAWCRH